MKNLVILRGCSGSGKSTKAKELVKQKINDISVTSIICSTDEFFINPKTNRYEFDFKLLYKAHAWNQGRVYQAMSLNINFIVLDNTNTQKWEFLPYLKTAELFNYEAEEIIVGKFDDANIKLYANRNKHNVPLEIIRKQAKRFER